MKPEDSHKPDRTDIDPETPEGASVAEDEQDVHPGLVKYLIEVLSCIVHTTGQVEQNENLLQ